MVTDHNLLVCMMRQKDPHNKFAPKFSSYLKVKYESADRRHASMFLPIITITISAYNAFSGLLFLKHSLISLIRKL